VLGTVLGRAVQAGGPHDGRDPAELAALLEAPTPVDRLLEAMIRLGAYGDGFGVDPKGLTFARLRDAPHGIDLGPLEPRVPDIVTTPSGCIELAPAPVAADVPRLAATLGGPPPGARGDGFVLIGRRHVRSNNSWMHNVELLVKGRDRCTLQMHPDDADRLGLLDGSRAEVRSRVGAVVAPVEITTDIRPGVLSLPHGWGHDAEGADLTVAATHAGVNANRLTDDAEIDPLSGNAVLNGVPVSVAPA
jgi:anaerobic selenocysteine-containing dehydrogenase